MARITSQKATAQIGNIFELVLVASQRARQLKNGHAPKIKTQNGNIITALTEIEEGLYTKKDYYNNIKGSK